MAVFAMTMLLLTSAVFATAPVDSQVGQVTIEEVEVNGIRFSDIGVDSFVVEESEDDEIEIEVTIRSGDVPLYDVEVEAELNGFEYSDYIDTRDQTTPFDMDPMTVKKVDLTIPVGKFYDDQVYTLEITVEDRDSVGDLAAVSYPLSIEPSRHLVTIDDVYFSPGTEVQAGRSLLTTVVVENDGDNDEEDVRVTVAIPALNIQATDFIEEVETRQDNDQVAYEATEELFLGIPACALPGTYAVDVTVEYDNFESITETYSIDVLEGDFCHTDSAEKVVIAVGPETQNVVPGQQAVYTVVLSNEGTNTETFTLELTTGDWATTSLSDSVVVLAEGASEVVYAYATVAEDAAAGLSTASLVISNEGQVLESVSLNANVQATEGGSIADGDFSLRNGLELALIILVVLLVIIGLIIGFSRLRRDEEEETYY